jgi:hypothetical protein
MMMETLQRLARDMNMLQIILILAPVEFMFLKNLVLLGHQQK